MELAMVKLRLFYYIASILVLAICGGTGVGFLVVLAS